MITIIRCEIQSGVGGVLVGCEWVSVGRGVGVSRLCAGCQSGVGWVSVGCVVGVSRVWGGCRSGVWWVSVGCGVGGG